MSGEEISDFDDATSFLGDYGLFQVMIMVLLSVSVVPCGYMGVLTVFIADTSEHHCTTPANLTRNGTVDLPSFRERSRRIGPDSCSRYKVINSTEDTMIFSNDTEPCVDGWVYSTEKYAATIVSEWDLVCDDAWKVPLSTSLFFVGMTIGTLVAGQLSDWFGRKPLFFSSLALQTVVTLIQAASGNWAMFCVLNFLRGISQISYITAVILGSEILNKSARVSYTLLGHDLGYGLGYALLPLLAFFIQEWRMLLVTAALPGFLFIALWWVIPESPRWLLQKGRVAEAEAVIRNAAKRNKVPAPDVIFREDNLALMQNTDGQQQTYSYLDLIRTTNMRNITILTTFIWLASAMVYYGLALSTSNMNGNAYLNCLISAATDIVAYIAVWLLINRVPRPTILFFTLLFCGVMLVLVKIIPEDKPVISQTLALLGKLCVSASYGFVFVFTPELFPTVVRNMGVGMASTASRIGSVICPYVIYAGVYNKSLPFIIFGTVSIIAAGLSVLLPDTKNDKLPNHISQAKPIRGFNALRKSLK
ncbi:solute carrier family 22 member 5-like [Thalassophryne amazonica]|uniref:solute carrier family 22 member 5-like n=1 Tax=Thalassophryne amazonica TaxID=390379 RepID=UPI001471818D|nr:solute carrier family 22 member 5-like [Thalassophryne amazonica]